MAASIETSSLSVTGGNLAGADFQTAATAGNGILVWVDPRRTSHRDSDPDGLLEALGIPAGDRVRLGDSARQFRSGNVVTLAALPDIDQLIGSHDHRPCQLLVIYGRAMNLEAVWRADPFNGLPLGAYVVRVYKFGSDFADNWYVAWLSDQFHALSLPQYLNQLDAHSAGSLERWYDVWRSDTANRLSYPDYLNSLAHHGETLAETAHPGWVSSSTTTSFPEYLKMLTDQDDPTPHSDTTNESAQAE